MNVKLTGPIITLSVHRDTERMEWRARCENPPFLVTALDNKMLMKRVEESFDNAFNDDPGLLEKLGLKPEEEIKGTERHHFDVPWNSVKV